MTLLDTADDLTALILHRHIFKRESSYIHARSGVTVWAEGKSLLRSHEETKCAAALKSRFHTPDILLPTCTQANGSSS